MYYSGWGLVKLVVLCGSSTGLESELLSLLWAALCMCPLIVLSLAFISFTNSHYIFKQLGLCKLCPISGFAFLELISPFLFSLISSTGERYGVGRATSSETVALQQSDSCPADAQWKLNGHNQVLSGKMQEPGNHPSCLC